MVAYSKDWCIVNVEVNKLLNHICAASIKFKRVVCKDSPGNIGMFFVELQVLEEDRADSER